MKRLTFLAHPPFIKSASDVIGPRTVSEMRRHGVDARLEYLWSDSWARRLLSNRNRVGYLLFKYITSPLGTNRLLNSFGVNDLVWMYDISLFANLKSTKLEAGILKKGGTYIFQLHDDWLSVPGYEQAAQARFKLASLVGGVTRGIIESIIMCAPGTMPELLRAPIDVDRLTATVPSAKALPKVVWTGNPQNLREIPGSLDMLSAVYGRCKFDFVVISGSTKPELELPIPWNWLPYSEDEEATRLSGACAGLAPLEDRPYARCKDVFKVKTYMACGVAPIASAIGNNLEVIRDGETGFLVNTRDEWEARLLELVSSPEKSAAMGAAARVDCANRFSHAAIIPEWIGTLEQRFGALRSGG